MDADVAEGYWRAITVIEAQNLLIQMRLADYPRSDQSSRHAWHREIHKLAYPRARNLKAMTTEEVFNEISGQADG